jgi:hypothetical protein
MSQPFNSVIVPRWTNLYICSASGRVRGAQLLKTVRGLRIVLVVEPGDPVPNTHFEINHTLTINL